MPKADTFSGSVGVRLRQVYHCNIDSRVRAGNTIFKVCVVGGGGGKTQPFLDVIIFFETLETWKKSF